jgi:hypothetical protein
LRPFQFIEPGKEKGIVGEVGQGGRPRRMMIQSTWKQTKGVGGGEEINESVVLWLLQSSVLFWLKFCFTLLPYRWLMFDIKEFAKVLAKKEKLLVIFVKIVKNSIPIVSSGYYYNYTTQGVFCILFFQLLKFLNLFFLRLSKKKFLNK